MNLIALSSKASMISTFSSPGTPKMYSTSSFSKHFTNSSAAFMSFPFAWDNLGGCRVCETTLRCQLFRPPLDAEKRIKWKVKELTTCTVRLNALTNACSNALHPCRGSIPEHLARHHIMI